MVVIALAAFIIFFIMSTTNYTFYLTLIFLVTTNWILELIIAKYEKNNIIFNNFPILQVFYYQIIFS